ALRSFDADPDDYRRLAENWAVYNVFGTETTPTAFRPPLYPWTLKTFVYPLIRADERPAAPHVADDASLQAPNSPDASVSPNLTQTPADADAANLPKSPNPPQPTGERSVFDRYFALSRPAAFALFHWLLGVATVAVVYRFARRLDFGPKSAAAVGFLVAVDPILLQQSRLVMTETLAALFAALLLDATAAVVARRSSNRTAPKAFAPAAFAALGVLFGVSTLCRPAFFAFAGLVFLLFAAQGFAVAVKTRKLVPNVPIVGAVRRAFLGVALFLVGIGAAVAPWTLRNLRAFDRPILTTTHGGYTRYLAHNPEIYRHFESTSPWSLWDPEPFHRRRAVEYAAALADAGLEPGSTEAELFQNRWTSERADETIRSAPRTFLYSIGLRVGELWRVLPNAVDAEGRPLASPDLESPRRRAARFAVAVFYSFELNAAILGAAFLAVRAFRRRRETPVVAAALNSPWTLGFLLVASVQIPHLIYWTNMRMRAPLEIFVPALAIFGVAALLRRRAT
ncbi:MAG: phospholipid carrier-dependent glycosyltransferase, partial [Thermoguttaceae bacterium]|nr:phospholipid carrier-dependent glycosyltransferase [Thermoguttaceae bacterium]